MPANLRRVFHRPAVVVTGDGTGADVAALAHLRIAEVGQVVGLGAASETRLLQLNEVADVRRGLEDGARPEPRERADDGPLVHDRAVEMTEGADLHPRADLRVLDEGRSLDLRARANLDRAHELYADADHGLRLDRHLGVDEGVVGVAEGDAALLMRGDEPLPEHLLGRGELRAGVGAEHLPRILGQDRDGALLARGHGHHVGEVDLVLCVLAAEATDGAPQQVSVAEVDADVHFANQALGRARVLLFDHGAHQRPLAQHTAIAEGPIELGGQDRERGAAHRAVEPGHVGLHPLVFAERIQHGGKNRGGLCDNQRRAAERRGHVVAQ